MAAQMVSSSVTSINEKALSALVVALDDEERSFVAQILTLLGVSVLGSVCGGEEAGSWLVSNPCDLMVVRLEESCDQVLGSIFSLSTRPALVVIHDNPMLLDKFDAQVQSRGLFVAGRLKSPFALAEFGRVVLEVRERHTIAAHTVEFAR